MLASSPGAVQENVNNSGLLSEMETDLKSLIFSGGVVSGTAT